MSLIDLMKYLLFNRVTTLLGNIDKEQNGGTKMGKSGNRLHFNGITLLKWVIENTRGIEDLPTEMSVVHVTDEERLRRESVRLDINIGASNFVHKGAKDQYWWRNEAHLLPTLG